MFQSTGWILEEPDMSRSEENKYKPMAIVKSPESEIPVIEIIQQYQFSSPLQRMSALVKLRGSNELRNFTKGSPEMILSLSRSKTYSDDVMITLQRYTEQGYRVIAIGCSEIDVNDSVEVRHCLSK